LLTQVGKVVVEALKSLNKKQRHITIINKGVIMCIQTDKSIVQVGDKPISKQQLSHYRHKHLYYHMGDESTISLKEFISTYDSEHYGDINKYSTSICPCLLCLEISTGGLILK